MTDQITEHDNQRPQEPISASKFVAAGERIIQDHAHNPEFLQTFSQETKITRDLIDALEVGEITKEQLIQALSATRALDMIEKERDPLTGIYNRRGFMHRFRENLALAQRSNEDIYIAMIDIDYFKKINDEHGHPFGDTVIQNVAKLLKSNSRKSDLIARWGGEEFIILMPRTNKKGAIFHAEKLRSRMPESVTISVGVAGLDKVSEAETSKGKVNRGINIDELINLADKRLYLAKKSGRNKVVSSQNEQKIKADFPED